MLSRSDFFTVILNNLTLMRLGVRGEGLNPPYGGCLTKFRLLLLFIDLSLTIFLSLLCSQLQIPYTQSVCFTTQLFYMIAAAFFPVFYFLFLKLNLFEALHLCSFLPFLLPTECCQTVLLIEKCETLFSRLFLARQNTTRIFRIILNIIAFYNSR